MEKKLVIIFEIIFVIVAIGYYVVKEMIPEYKTMYGSSDKIVNSEKMTNMIEVKVDDNIDFIIMFDDNEKIYHMMFLTKYSTKLYNQNIENQSIDNGINNIVKILIKNDLLKTNSKIELYKNNDKYYSNFINSLKKSLTKYNINTYFTENKLDIIKRAKELNIETGTENAVIVNIDFYSKELVDTYKDYKSDIIVCDMNSSLKLSNNVYKKIEKYVNNNNIDNLEKNNTKLVISTIPADEDLKYYPSTNSWYYVENKKVYAYIEFVNNSKYSYCYKGSIDDVVEGECD